MLRQVTISGTGTGPAGGLPPTTYSCLCVSVCLPPPPFSQTRRCSRILEKRHVLSWLCTGSQKTHSFSSPALWRLCLVTLSKTFYLPEPLILQKSETQLGGY